MARKNSSAAEKIKDWETFALLETVPDTLHAVVTPMAIIKTHVLYILGEFAGTDKLSEENKAKLESIVTIMRQVERICEKYGSRLTDYRTLLGLDAPLQRKIEEKNRLSSEIKDISKKLAPQYARANDIASSMRLNAAEKNAWLREFRIMTSTTPKVAGTIERLAGETIFKSRLVPLGEFLRELRDFSEPFRVRPKSHFRRSIFGKLSEFSKNIDMKVEIPRNLQGVLIDSHLLLPSLFNLISNSIKFIPEYGEIVIKAEMKKGKLKLSYSDSGPGIPKNLRKRIWDVGFTTPGKYAGLEVEGTGLGLSLSKIRFKQAGGDIKLRRSARRGAWPSKAQPGEIPRGVEFELHVPTHPPKKAKVIPIRKR